uniref:Uncharacterized protein n=1 Tax=Anguilla anguilla TaxID=7936 RepID=A0A0E9XM85_ANGAN
MTMLPLITVFFGKVISFNLPVNRKRCKYKKRTGKCKYVFLAPEAAPNGRGLVPTGRGLASKIED